MDTNSKLINSQGFQILDKEGNLTKIIVAGESTIYAPLSTYKKVQFATKVGVVTEEQLNAKDSEGRDVYEIQGNGWKPQGLPGDIFLQDINNPVDKWFVKPNLFQWQLVDGKDNVWEKPDGKTFEGYELPVGTVLKTLESEYISKKDDILTCINSELGDFYCVNLKVAKKVN
jgi:hypothetical protein